MSLEQSVVFHCLKGIILHLIVAVRPKDTKIPSQKAIGEGANSEKNGNIDSLIRVKKLK